MPDRRYINQTTGEIIEDIEPRPFTDVLRELGEGATLSEMSDGLWDLIQRVQDTAKAGKLTLTLTVAFDGQGRLVVKDNVDLKLPEFSRPETRFFIDKTGNASRRNPNQPVLPSLDDHRTRKDIS